VSYVLGWLLFIALHVAERHRKFALPSGLLQKGCKEEPHLGVICGKKTEEEFTHPISLSPFVSTGHASHCKLLVPPLLPGCGI
jgi:hypothetical protein